MEGARPCPACGSAEAGRLDRFKRVPLARCANCRLVFTCRLPTPAELDDWYADYPELEGVSPITEARLDEIVETFAPYRESGRILDVGAGSGYLLEAAERGGWSPHGVEFPEHLRERGRARGWEMHVPLLEGPPLPDGHFDVVCLDGVLEHMAAPREELTEAVRVCRPGGLVWITVPNFRSASRFVLGDRWTVVEYPEHLNYFEPASLTRLAASLGLTRRRLLTTGVSLDRAVVSLKGRDEAGQESPGADQRIRAAASGSKGLTLVKEGVDRVLTASRTGETIKGWFERA